MPPWGHHCWSATAPWPTSSPAVPGQYVRTLVVKHREKSSKAVFSGMRAIPPSWCPEGLPRGASCISRCCRPGGTRGATIPNRPRRPQTTNHRNTAAPRSSLPTAPAKGRAAGGDPRRKIQTTERIVMASHGCHRVLPGNLASPPRPFS